MGYGVPLERVRQYLVHWEGYAEKDQTWEPMENLVGCAAQIREYERERERIDKEAKENVLEKPGDSNHLWLHRSPRARESNQATMERRAHSG
mmetsp:Transcript_29030/g.72407  ORF Transcript_29030/g.72407 Transcript_29030/m.72407 type:complete len:92 (+) Transcript_29030:52-327(+)